MEDRHRSLLRRHTVSFRRDLEPKKILPYLVTILDPDDEQQIKNQPIRDDQVDKLLDILPRRGPQAFHCFVEALESVQPHLGDLIREDEEIEKKISEMKSELGRVRSYSAKLRDELRVACVSLESEKNKQDHVKKELEELKSLHKALLYQSKHEKEKLLFNINQLNITNERLLKDVEFHKEQTTSMKDKCSKLEKELKNKQMQIELLKTDFQSINACNFNARKVSVDETKSRNTVDHSSRRRTYSDRSENGKIFSTFQSEEDSTNVLNKKDEETIGPKEHDNTQLIDLERKLERLSTERDFALEYSKNLEEQVKNYKDTRIHSVHKGTSTEDDLDINTCKNCTKVESIASKLRKEMESKINVIQEDARKENSALRQINDDHEMQKEALTNEIKNLRKELITHNENELKNIKTVTDEFESQVERDKLTIARLKSELDKERETARTQNKEFEKYKKKAISEKKQAKKKLEEDNKTKNVKLRDLEKELKNSKDEERKGLDNIGKLKEQLREEKDAQEQLRDELIRWRTLPGRVFNFKKEFDRNGIVYTLGTSFNTTQFINPASTDNNRIKVCRSSCHEGHPMDILDPRKGTLSCTADIEHSWWQVDLGEPHALLVTHYTLRHGRDNGLSILRNWNLEGSRDGKNWKVLRRHENDRGMKGTYPFYTGTWSIEGRIEAMRYFRIHQTGKNSSGRHALYLSGFEMYGVLLEL